MENKPEIRVLFDSFSHVKYRKMTPNDSIKKINIGDEYNIYPYAIHPEETGIRKKHWFFNGGVETRIATEPLFQSVNNYFRTEDEVLDDWNNTVMCIDGKWYNKPWIEIWMLNNEKFRAYYKSDEDMEAALNELRNENTKEIRADV